MALLSRSVTLPLAAVVCVFAVASVAATRAVAVAESLAAAAPQDASAVEASLPLDRSTRRLIQRGLRNEGFNPGTPDGLFGPRTRAAIRDWQQSRGASPTGYLNRAEAELLRTAAAPPPAAPEARLPPEAVAAVAPSTSSPAAGPASTSTETDSRPASPAAVAAEAADSQNAAETNTRQGTRAGRGNGAFQLPPEVLVDRHLLRADRLLAGGDPADALEAMNEVLALQEEHELALQDGFDFEYAQVAYAAGRTETAIAAANQYLATAGRLGEFCRDALELLDSAEVRLEREAAERRRAEAARRRAEAERRHAARWPPGYVFRDCETCPEMVVLPESSSAVGPCRGADAPSGTRPASSPAFFLGRGKPVRLTTLCPFSPSCSAPARNRLQVLSHWATRFELAPGSPHRPQRLAAIALSPTHNTDLESSPFPQPRGASRHENIAQAYRRGLGDHSTCVCSQWVACRAGRHSLGTLWRIV